MARRTRHAASALTRAKAACRPALTTVFVLSLFINLSMLTLPLFSMQLYDRVLSSGNHNTLIFLALIAVLFLVIFGILDYVRSGILLRLGLRFEDALKRPLFDTLFRMDSKGDSSAAQQALSDAQTMRDTIGSTAVAALFDLPWTPLFVMLCFALHPLLGTVSLIGVVILFVLAVTNELLTHRKLAETGEHAATNASFSGSVFTNQDAMRSLGMGDTLRQRWITVQDKASNASAVAGERAVAVQSASKSARFIIQLALLTFGAWLAIEREISPGVMLAASIIMGRALAPVEQVVAQWRRIVGFRQADARLRQLFATTESGAATTDLARPQGHIRVEKAAIPAVSGGKPVIMGVDFALAAGQSLAIVGASGSGKSTLARALVGSCTPISGAIRIDNAAFAQWDISRLGKFIGYVAQDVDLLEGTIAENIGRFREATMEEIVAAANEACVHDAILRLPEGYETKLGNGGLGLSGGMRQRVALARALFGDPCLVVLDEPNSNLDEEGDRAFTNSVSNMTAAGRTLIVVTHRPQILQHLDYLLVMGMGRQIAFGPRQDVIRRMRGNKMAAV